MLNPDELRRLREAATPGPVSTDGYIGKHPCVNTKWTKDDCFLRIADCRDGAYVGFSNQEKQANADFIAYLWNHAAEIEEALREREMKEHH